MQNLLRKLRFWKRKKPESKAKRDRRAHNHAALQVHRWLHQIFLSRNIPDFAVALKHPMPGFEQIWLYHDIKLHHYKGKAFPNDADVTLLVDTRYRFLKKQAVDMAITQACLRNQPDEILRLIDRMTPEDVRKMRKSIIMGAVRLLLKSNMHERARPVVDVFLAERTLEERLDFAEIAQDLDLCQSLFGTDDIDWRKLRDLFTSSFSAADEDARREFQTLYVGPYDKISDGADFMDIRTSPTQRQELHQHILRHIKERKPLSLIRAGDGSAYVFAPPAIQYAPENYKPADDTIRENLWWSSSPTTEQREKIRTQVHRAFDNADILGIPSLHRLIRDRGVPGTRLGQMRSARGLITTLDGLLNKIQDRQRIYTEDRVNHLVFDEPRVEELAAAADHVVLVTCWAREDLKAGFLSKADFIRIPPDTKAGDAAIETPFFSVYEDHVAQVRQLSRPGVLVLVAAGLLGKIIVDAARDQGAVAIDTGCVIDYFAGRRTRSIAEAL